MRRLAKAYMSSTMLSDLMDKLKTTGLDYITTGTFLCRESCHRLIILGDYSYGLDCFK